jgi:hypothetical protein
MSDTTLNIALQEWAVACSAMGDGRLLLSVRKGGIHEQSGGFFRPEHDRFLLMPTYLHQDASRVQPAFAAEVDKADPAPGSHEFSLWAEVATVWKVTDLTLVQSLGPDLLWSDLELATRFAYRNEPWLYVLALRIMRLPTPVIIPDLPAYAGCRSWIPLQSQISLAGSTPVVSTGRFEIRLERINAILTPGRTISQSISRPGLHRSSARRTPRISE